MKSDSSVSADSREFARVETTILCRLRELDDEEIEGLRLRLRISPSIWSPTNEATLRDWAARSSSDPSNLLAEAVVELSDQVVRLRARLTETAERTHPATLTQLSGGGGRLSCPLAFESGTLLELQLDDEDSAVPPIRGIIEIVHAMASQDASHLGFRYDTIHPKDESRLMRLIYQLQRQAIRDSRE